MLKNLDINKALSDLTKPEHPVLLISGKKGYTVNIMPAGWVTRTSHNPPIIAVSVGFSRYTHDLMTKFENFVLAYPIKGQKKIIKYTGNCSGRDVDKFGEINIKTRPGHRVELPVLENARVNFECKKKFQYDTGDHTLFGGEIIAARGDKAKRPLLNIGNYVYKEFKKYE
ncbi:MAG: flavin reductase family protein [Elusimicrobiota bacterium]